MEHFTKVKLYAKEQWMQGKWQGNTIGVGLILESRKSCVFIYIHI